MPRRLPPPHPKGAPRTPGSGRRKGTANRTTVELRMLMGAMAGDIDYQRKLRSDFRKRRLHPATELRVWEYAIGRPTEKIELSANVTTNQRLAAERDMLRQLDLKQLEALAAESQAMIDRALAAALMTPAARVTIDIAPSPKRTESNTVPESSGDKVACSASIPHTADGFRDGEGE
jgi:hypothetical protein